MYFKDHCFAFRNKLVDQLPVKEKKIKIVTRWFNYLVIESNKKIYIHKRTGSDIWNNLHEFVLVETGKNISVKAILIRAEKEKILKRGSYKIVSISPVYSQQLSHQKIMGRFIKIVAEKEITIKGFRPVSVKQLSRYAFPRFITAFFERGHS